MYVCECTQLKHQNCLNFLSPTGNVYFNKIAQHCVCATSEHLSSPLYTVAQRNAEWILPGIFNKMPLNRQAVAHGDLNPELTQVPQWLTAGPGSEPCQGSHFA